MSEQTTMTPERAPEGRDLNVTERAARRIAALQREEEHEGLMLRVSVSGGGCQGFRYGFTLDDHRGEDDTLIERDGARVVIDEISLQLLAGSEVDFVEDLVGSYFTVKNPNATSSCGCGSSFSV